jgi:type VI secretion system protein ImpJ
VKAHKPIFWRQGMFLQPQHFQLTEAFRENQNMPLREYGQHYFWGVAELEINEPGLGNKLFEVHHGEFVFPDGTYVKYPGNAIIPARSFDADWVESEKPFTVYLGLYKHSSVGENVTDLNTLDQGSQASTRYLSTYDPEDAEDRYGVGPTAKVHFLTFGLKIFWETEIGKVDNCHLMPIAQLEREGDDIKLSKSFIPPCLSIRANAKLEGLVKEIRDLIATRCRQLEEYKSPKDVQGMELEIRFLIFLLALRTLNRYVPSLYHFTETRDVHPWEIYGLVRQMLGELSTFSERLNAFCEDKQGKRQLPQYDHENLWLCFSMARTLVARVLEGIMMGPEFLIRLIHDGEYYAAEAPDTLFDEGSNYWLVLRTTLDRDALLTAVRNVAKLSAAKNLTTLIARAVPGVPLEYASSPPSGLPRSPNSHYFKIDRASALWQDVERTKNIALYWDTAPDDLVAEIIVLRS